jgi:hypothetical protein
MEVVEARIAQAIAYTFLLGFFLESKSSIVFWGWPEMAVVSAFQSAISVRLARETERGTACSVSSGQKFKWP